MGDQVKSLSQKILKSLIEDPYGAHPKVQVLIFNLTLFSSPYRVPRSSYPFRQKFGDQGKCRSQKKLKSLIEVPYVVHVKVYVLSFNMIFISSP